MVVSFRERCSGGAFSQRSFLLERGALERGKRELLRVVLAFLYPSFTDSLQRSRRAKYHKYCIGSNAASATRGGAVSSELGSFFAANRALPQALMLQSSTADGHLSEQRLVLHMTCVR